jgi:hypothetical protein
LIVIWRQIDCSLGRRYRFLLSAHLPEKAGTPCLQFGIEGIVGHSCAKHFLGVGQPKGTLVQVCQAKTGHGPARGKFSCVNKGTYLGFRFIAMPMCIGQVEPDSWNQREPLRRFFREGESLVSSV